MKMIWTDALKQEIANGYIGIQHHPTLPLRIFNYTHKATIDERWSTEICFCRGLIIDDTDEVIARPQPKFFNLGQTVDIVGQGLLEFSEEFVLGIARAYGNELEFTDKIDGQMGIVWNYKEHWGVATRGSFTSDGAIWATAKFQKFVKYGMVECIPKGLTLIVEIVAKHLRIVIPYDYEALVLLTTVMNDTGDELRHWQLEGLWKELNAGAKGKPWCRVVPAFSGKTLMACRQDKDLTREGYVVSVRRGGQPPLKVKIKLEEYLRLHRLVTNVTPQMIWEQMGDPLKPWLRPTHLQSQLPPHFKTWIEEWQRRLYQAFHFQICKALDVLAWITPLRAEVKDDREFYRLVIERDMVLGPIAMMMMDNRIWEAHEALWKIVRPHGRDVFYIDGQGEDKPTHLIAA
jgi:RNA ligase